MSQIRAWGQVKHLGLYGGGPEVVEAVDSGNSTFARLKDVAKPVAHCVEMWPLMPVNDARRRHFEYLRKRQIMIFATNIYGSKRELIRSVTGEDYANKTELFKFAKQHKVDPCTIVLRWAAELNIVALTSQYKVDQTVPQNVRELADVCNEKVVDDRVYSLATRAFMKEFMEFDVNLRDVFEDQFLLTIDGNWNAQAVRGSVNADAPMSFSSLFTNCQ